MNNTVTNAQEIYDVFESSFQDKCIIPDSLELIWLKSAVARYSGELDTITFDEENLVFDRKLDPYTILTLGAFMSQSYQKREVSKVNKRVSIVSKDISIDGNNGSKTAANNELNYTQSESEKMVNNQKPTAYV